VTPEFYDSTRENEPPTLHLLAMLPPAIRRDHVMLVRFHHDSILKSSTPSP